MLARKWGRVEDGTEVGGCDGVALEEVREAVEGGLIDAMAQIDPQIVTCVEKCCRCVDRNSSVRRVQHTQLFTGVMNRKNDD